MSAIKKMTSMGGDIRQIAKLLQAKAPPGHKLAFISEEEAALLKSRGGSGRITPEGIPSYEETGFSADQIASAQASDQGNLPPTPSQAAPVTQNIGEQQITTSGPPTGQSALPGVSTSELYSAADASDVAPKTAGYQAANIPQGTQITGGYYQGSPVTAMLPTGTSLTPQDISQISVGQTPTDFEAAQAKAEQQALADAGKPPAKSFSQKAIDALTAPQTLGALGVGGIQAALAAQQIKRAQAQGQETKAQQQALAAPYQQQGNILQAQALRGELSPANQQVLQAAQARLAQTASARGGVGAAQDVNQIASLQQNLLQNQFNLGQSIQQVGDKIAIGAINSGVQADQYVNTLTANYTTNIARTLFGVAPTFGGGTGTQTTTQTGTPVA
jgi:hypothetical protein